MSEVAEYSALLSFWREAGEAKWFAKDEDFDRRFRESFLTQHEQAVRGELQGWMDSAEGALAVILLLDQFPRNAFRGTPRAFASDPAAREAARRALEAKHDLSIEPRQRIFFYLPFEHSEDLEDQRLSLELHSRIDYIEYAQKHYDIILRFGRFPHRNAILGRQSTAEELQFLADGGFAG